MKSGVLSVQKHSQEFQAEILCIFYKFKMTPKSQSIKPLSSTECELHGSLINLVDVHKILTSPRVNMMEGFTRQVTRLLNLADCIQVKGFRISSFPNGEGAIQMFTLCSCN